MRSIAGGASTPAFSFKRSGIRKKKEEVPYKGKAGLNERRRSSMVIEVIAQVSILVLVLGVIGILGAIGSLIASFAFLV